MFKRKAPFISVVLLVFSLSCNSKQENEKIEQGIIEFKIDYPTIAENDILLEFLPTQMEFIFKDNSYRNNIVAGMGLFSTSFINNQETKSITQTVKMLNNKYVSTLQTEDLINDPNFRNLEIEFLEDEKEIAGYNCKLARITVHGDSVWTYDAYYTKEIGIDYPNRLTPFDKIDGVLLDYQIIKYNTHMHFTAEEVIPKEINGQIERIDEGYETVTSEELGLEIKNIFAKLNQ